MLDARCLIPWMGLMRASSIIKKPSQNVVPSNLCPLGKKFTLECLIQGCLHFCKNEYELFPEWPDLFLIASSMSGRKASIFSRVSTISMTIGKSSESRRILAVWIRLCAPNPSKPGKTIAPVKPFSRARCTIHSKKSRKIVSKHNFCFQAIGDTKRPERNEKCGVNISEITWYLLE